LFKHKKRSSAAGGAFYRVFEAFLEGYQHLCARSARRWRIFALGRFVCAQRGKFSCARSAEIFFTECTGSLPNSEVKYWGGGPPGKTLGCCWLFALCCGHCGPCAIHSRGMMLLASCLFLCTMPFRQTQHPCMDSRCGMPMCRSMWSFGKCDIEGRYM
jgi:hypothetical protein